MLATAICNPIQMRKFISLSILFLFWSLSAFAQKGIIRGTIFDNSSGEALIGVTVVIDGTTIGSATDFDGKFEIQTEPGNYNLRVSYVSYSSLTIEDTPVKAGEVTLLDNIRLNEDVAQLDEVVVTAQAIRTTEEAMLTVKMKSTNVLDGISSSSFRKIGDSDAASAVRRVPGVSVEDGKYVFVRGLGDRYTKSTLNGLDLPGLDPDRNTVQMDMFPTSLIDNIIVLKSFTSDLPGDFTGGIVNIETKDFPEEKIFNISINGGYNPAMHFNKNYLTYTGSSTDFLGFDDGMRAFPVAENQPIPLYPSVIGRPDSQEGLAYRSVLDGFNPNMAAIKERSFMDYGFGLNFGNQKVSRESTIGYNLSLNYRNTTEFYSDAEFGRYGKDNADQPELVLREQQMGDYGTNSVILSGVAGFAIKRAKSKYGLKLLHSQNGESRGGVFDFTGSELGSNFEAIQNNLEYSERAMTNALLSGEHYFKDATWELDWKLSPTRSSITDPDIRFIRYREDGVLTIGSEVGFPERIWRFLEEDNLAGKADVKRRYDMFGKAAELKFGGGYTYKQRNYEIKGFQFVPQGVPLTGDPNEIFAPENLWPRNASGTQGTYYNPGFLPENTNKYEATIRNAAYYVSDEFSFSEKFKTILGIRMENYVQNYTGLNQQKLALNNVKVLDDIDFFPSVNLIYSAKKNQNFRASYSRTVARPSFKEASYAEIFDPLTGRTFIGGFFPDQNSKGEIIWDGNLASTRINNFDLRWEVFRKQGQTISLSTFYKIFDSPIEIVQFVQAPNNFQPRNVGDGKVLGVEIEARQSLEILTDKLSAFSINANVTVTQSSIKMSETEYNSRLTSARTDEVIKDTRDMAGQAPYLVNLGLTYNQIKNGIDAGFYYNVQGQTLTFVGVADRPDVYSIPFHSLNFNANKRIGERIKVGIGASNLLNSERKLVFKSFESNDKTFSSLKPGARINFSFSYNFN